MSKELHPGYLYSAQNTTINNEELFQRCLLMETVVMSATPPAGGSSWYGTAITAKHGFYNLFTFPVKELIELYDYMREQIGPKLDPDTTYVLKGWLNVYRAGERIDWHDHWAPKFRVWHGFYCVNVGDSATIYRIPGRPDEVRIKSEPGLLVFGKSDGDKHSSTAWTDVDTPRVTLAFDIVPIDTLCPNRDFDGLHLNHYIPFQQGQL